MSTAPPPEPCVFSDPQFSDDSETGGLVESIMARGVVRVGVLPNDAAPFFFCNQGVQSGFEASLARLLVEDALGDVEIRWVPLASGDRITVVQEGGVDFAVRFTTITPERDGQVAFTTPYLMDGPAVVVPAGAGVTDAAGLDGLRIAVLEGTGLERELTGTLEGAGVIFEPIPAEAPEDLMALVASGAADAYGTSWTRGMQDAQDPGYAAIPLSFTSAIAVYSSQDEPALNAALDASLVNLIDSGVWSSEFLSAFGVSSPWSTEEMALAR
jgi:ABC-type amino acid transport substrate-binding protein